METKPKGAGKTGQKPPPPESVNQQAQDNSKDKAKPPPQGKVKAEPHANGKEMPKETKQEKPKAAKEEKPKVKVDSKGKGTNKGKTAKSGGDDGSEYAQTIQGSNCWAVHGNHTASGLPIVAGDPHLNTGVPTIWVFSGIQIKDEYSFGSSIPGVAGTFFGRSKRHTWAITSMGADIGDVFEERIEGNKYNY